MESVFSMDEVDGATMSQHMETIPTMVDAAGISLCRRPRLYRVWWELVAAERVRIGPPVGEGWAQYRVVELSATNDPQDFLTSGWHPTPGGEVSYFYNSTTTHHQETVPRDCGNVNLGNLNVGGWMTTGTPRMSIGIALGCSMRNGSIGFPISRKRR